jgi:hypothetical protein
VLGDGPDRDGAAPFDEQVRRASAAARRRRRTGLAGTTLLLAAAAALAGRYVPEPQREPAAPRPSVVASDPARFVADIAVGTRWAYALVASCTGPEPERRCSYRLFRRSVGGGGWHTTALETAQVAWSVGPARLFVTGDDVVTVLDQPTVGTAWVSADSGDTVHARPLRPGPPVAAVPPSAVVDLALCESCLGRLTVLEPGTARLRPLATPPPLGPALLIRSAVRAGGVLWVLGDGGSRLVSAVSTDRGRSWRVLPVGGARAPAGPAWLASDGGRGACLLIGRDRGTDVRNDFSELWRIGDPSQPGAAWRERTPAVRPRSAAGLLAGARGLLVREDTGKLWRLLSDGTMLRLPPVAFDGVPVAPAWLVTGPAALLIGIVSNQADLGSPTVMISYDDGESWLVEQIRG